jgi:hypothetical protein
MIVKREQGVTDFAHAEETDALIQPRSARDTVDNIPAAERNAGDSNIVDAVENAFRAVDPDANDEYRRQ